MNQTIRLDDGSEVPLQQLLDQALRLHQAGALDEAKPIYERILQAHPGQFHALHFLGLIHHQQGRHLRAEELILQALASAPGDADALCNLGAVYNAMQKSAEAADRFQEALAIDPALSAALNGLGNARFRQGRLDEAQAQFEQALRASPGYPEAGTNLSMVLQARGDLESAEQAVRKALQAATGHSGCLAQLGSVLAAKGDRQEAVSAYQASLKTVPDNADNWYNLGLLLDDARMAGEALSCYGRAMQIEPLHGGAISVSLFLRRALFDWDGAERLSQQYFQALEQGVGGLTPFSLTLEHSTAQQQRHCAELWARQFSGIGKLPPAEKSGTNQPDDDRLTLAYVSADFYQHPTAYLMAGLFEAHDHSKLRLIAYSNGPDDGSAIRRRVMAAFDEFVDVSGWTSMKIAERIRADRVDILVDLKGYTLDAMTEVFARRPAPVQISFLGYPGTMGAEFIDYLIADGFVIPDGSESAYSEKIIRLPDSYQVNDRDRETATDTPSRTELGLPDQGMVYCCFNASQKITRQTFARWVEILNAVPGSVLWLLDPDPRWPAKDHLRSSAKDLGLAPERLIFAKKLEQKQYLATYRHADLFLDTLPYNAHTTASDALWMGCPVLTLPGDTFASRVAGSILTAAELPELIMNSAQEYRDMAIHLGRDKQDLADLKKKLARKRETCALFDTGKFTRGFEKALLDISSERDL
ncbi:MAG: tetratricopeptide repeat protein [Gammaproteobacteria bacterium]|nr:tetratricopeptide repeat protein [Gammaproteobacteria bacterium]